MSFLSANPSRFTATQSEIPPVLCSSRQLKEMCRRELDKSESEIKKNGTIIGEYKQVWTELNDELLN